MSAAAPAAFFATMVPCRSSPPPTVCGMPTANSNDRLRRGEFYYVLSTRQISKTSLTAGTAQCVHDRVAQ